MPNFDQTGPNGEGPLTGRGLGDCNTPRGGRGFGRGFGRGNGRGFFGGFKRWCPFWRNSQQPIDEKQLLKQEIEDTKEYLNSLEKEQESIDKE